MITRARTFKYRILRFEPLVQEIEELHTWCLFGYRLFTYTETVIVSEIPGETPRVAGFKINQTTTPATPEKNTQL